MPFNQRLDKEKAITFFLANFEGLAFLPFITDEEMGTLFGDEVENSLLEFDRYNRQKAICRDCPDRCCALVNCEFYSASFNTCPVESYRPALCRMHFCHKFADCSPGLIQDLADVFLDSLLAATRRNSQTADLFDCPPLAPRVPALVDQILPILAAVRGGSNEDLACRMVENELTTYFRTK